MDNKAINTCLKFLLCGNLFEKDMSADKILKAYDLQLTRQIVLAAFYEINRYLLLFQCVRVVILLKFKISFSVLLRENKNMFVSIIHCYSQGYNTYCCHNVFTVITHYVSQFLNKPINSLEKPRESVIIEVYKLLLSLHYFEIDNLNISNECMIKIEEYRNEKYGGKLTKVAIN